MEQRERGEGYPPVTFAVSRLPHREVVGKGDAQDPRGLDAWLHSHGDGRDSTLLYGPAYQPHGPVAQGSGGSEQYGVNLVLGQPVGDLGGGFFHERGRVLDGAHEREVPPVQPANDALFGEGA